MTEVVPGSPASQGDLAPGMVIISAGDKKIANAEALASSLRKLKKGDSLLLRVRVPDNDVTLLRAITGP